MLVPLTSLSLLESTTGFGKSFFADKNPNQIILDFISPAVSLVSSEAGMTEVDAVLQDLSAVRWGTDEECRLAMVELMYGVRNRTLWATWVWDANARPSGVFYGSKYQLGGYSQCLNAPGPARTKYCLADVLLTHAGVKERTRELHPEDNADEYFDYKTRFGRHMDTVTWGICAPEACNEGGVRQMLPVMLRHSHLPIADVTVDSCTSHSEQHHGFGYKAFIWTFIILLSTAILATFYRTSPESESWMSTIISSFCMEKNWYELMKVNKDDIQTLNGMRVINSFTFAIAHYIYYSNYIGVVNYLDIEQALTTQVGNVWVHIDIGIDTFFALSGLLHMKGLLSSKRLSLWRILGKRYFRLVGPFAVTMWYIVSILPHTGHGPLWHRLAAPEARACVDNWWLGLLMVNNYVNCENICHLVSWYIQSDFQLTILGTVLFCVWLKNRRVGCFSFLAVALFGFLMPAVMTYWNNISPLLFSNTQQNIMRAENNIELKSVYANTLCRTNAYFIGMVMGYILNTYKPSEHKNVINKELSLLTAFVSLNVMLKIMKVAWRFFGKEYTGVDCLVFVTLNRSVWALAVCFLIAACEYGTVPLIGRILRCNFLVPFSRLAYGIYLVHMLFVYRIVHTIQVPITYDYIATLSGGFGISVLSLITAVLIWFTVEAPLINISTRLFKSKHGSEQSVKLNGIINNDATKIHRP